MINIRRITRGVLYITLLGSGAVQAGLNDLTWLQGNWSGAVGNATLEESWVQPAGGTMVATVRRRGEQSTQMVEIITISEGDDTLEFHLQQFSPALVPRTEVEFMKMVSQGDRSVVFAAPDQSKTTGLLGVKYSRDENDLLSIDVQLAEGNTFSARLHRIGK